MNPDLYHAPPRISDLSLIGRRDECVRRHNIHRENWLASRKARPWWRLAWRRG